MADAVTYEKIYESKLPEFKTPSKEYSDRLREYLDSKKIKLYSHQADSFDAVNEGKNIIITTPTASGKTFCYTLPVFDNLMKNSDARALFIYPTKALTRDQLISIKEIDTELKAKTKPEVYDGDTKTEMRSKIRETSRIILTNMYELHQILPYRAKWGDFFTNLSFIVIDEAHKYRGVFGSNTALLIRRLRRICNYYDSNPQFILSSATLGNSVNFAETLTGVPFTEISNDGSPHAKKIFKIFSDPNKTSITSAANLVSEKIKSGKQTICFTKSRTTAEITAVKCKENKVTGNIASYRGGYRPSERRKIETNLKNGEVSGVFSTNALEVGIDIGGLDSVVISGFPGSMTSFMQQAGRAGRKYQDSEITFIAGQSPIDQYYVKNPDSFFDSPTEEAILGIENPYILSAHLLCAAAELPYNSSRDRKYFGETADDIIEGFKEKRLVASTKRGYVYCGMENPAQTNTFFGTIGKTWAVVFGKNTLETMDDSQAYREAYLGAVILHQGEKFRVDKIEESENIIRVVKINDSYRTRAISTTEISVNSKEKTIRHGNLNVCFGDVTVSTQLIGYSVIEYDRIVMTNELKVAPRVFKTKACWITFDETAPLTPQNIAGSLHGTEHALIAAMPVYVLSDRSDIGGVSTPLHFDTASPTIFIYDGVAGGIGLAEKAAEIFPKIISLAEKIVSECECENGCPSCIQSPKCGNNNQFLDKQGTKTLLAWLKKESV